MPRYAKGHECKSCSESVRLVQLSRLSLWDFLSSSLAEAFVLDESSFVYSQHYLRLVAQEKRARANADGSGANSLKIQGLDGIDISASSWRCCNCRRCLQTNFREDGDETK